MRPENRKESSFPPTKARRRKKPRGAAPNAPIIIPDFHNVGHRPVGSIAYALAPYRKFFGRRRAQDIAIEAAQRIGGQYPILGKIVECWYLLPLRDRAKVLALDFTVEAFNMPIREFIGMILSVIQTEIIEYSRSVQFANMPELISKSMKRAMRNIDSANVVKEAAMHMQQHRLVPAPPNAPTVTVNTQVNAPTQITALPSPEDFAKRLDEATRAGREALPPANFDNVIEAEVVTSEKVEAV